RADPRDRRHDVARAHGALAGSRERSAGGLYPQPLADRLRPGPVRPDAQTPARDRHADLAGHEAGQRSRRTPEDVALSARPSRFQGTPRPEDFTDASARAGSP